MLQWRNKRSSMQASEVTPQNVKAMVDDFYAKVLADELIGHFFIDTLGKDLQKGKWIEHLNRLQNFWLRMMGQESTYQGSPIPSHLLLPDLEERHFTRWLELFDQTVKEHYSQEIADKFNKIADVVALQILACIEDDEL